MLSSTHFAPFYRGLLAVAACLPLAGCPSPAGSADGAASPEPETGESNPGEQAQRGATAATTAGNDACERARLLLAGEPIASEEPDLDAIRSGLRSIQPRDNADALVALRRAGATAAPLSDDLQQFLENAPATAVATEAARAYAAVMADGFPEAAEAILRATGTPLHVRYEVAAELGRAGELERLQTLMSLGGTTGAAARRAIIAARVNPKVVHDQLFAPGKLCADVGAEELCLQLSRDAMLYDRGVLDPAVSPINALLVAEFDAMQSGDLTAWRAALPAAEQVNREVAIASVRALASVGLSPRNHQVLLDSVNDPALRQTDRMLAGLLAGQSLDREGLVAPEPIDELGRAGVAAGTYSGAGRMHENAQAALESVGRENPNPFGAISLLLLARQGEPGLAENAAARSFPEGFADLLRAQATRDLDAAVTLVLLSAAPDDMATDAISVLAIGRRDDVVASVARTEQGSAERRARFFARLNAEDAALAQATAAALTAEPHLESVRWLIARDATETLGPLFQLSARTGSQAERRHAVLAHLAGAVELTPDLLDNIIVRPAPQQIVESRDLRSLAYRARFGDEAPSLEDAISLAEGLGEARAGRFEVNVALQRALDAHCAQ